MNKDAGAVPAENLAKRLHRCRMFLRYHACLTEPENERVRLKVEHVADSRKIPKRERKVEL